MARKQAFLVALRASALTHVMRALHVLKAVVRLQALKYISADLVFHGLANHCTCSATVTTSCFFSSLRVLQMPAR